MNSLRLDNLPEINVFRLTNIDFKGFVKKNDCSELRERKGDLFRHFFLKLFKIDIIQAKVNQSKSKY